MPTMLDRPRIIIENIYPELDGGRYPVKRVVGDSLALWADIFMDGHDMLRAVLRYREQGKKAWNEAPLREDGNDRWFGSFPLEKNGRYEYQVVAWYDAFGTWLRDVRKKIDAGLDVALEMKEGLAIAQQALGAGKAKTKNAAHKIDATSLLSADTAALMAQKDLRLHAAESDVLTVYVDRERAAFSAWYEIFPRSQGTDVRHSSTFADCEARLPDIRAMGFDVLYLTPIHPIGKKHRKGKNNSVTAKDGEPGSPYAISNHKEVHPDLGTLEDFRKLVEATKAHGMEIALDFAIQCAPDHPYITEHPEWFNFRPDGTIKYAENPPKKYQDIVNVDFYGKGAKTLWEELRSVVLFWVEQGVRIFRVDNPHTKPIPFWEWLIAGVQDKYPDVIFLSEAFTRPKVMYSLAKAGFTQSYTYFTWRNSKHELTEYLTELTTDWPKDYFRPNFFANTPDILPQFLQTSGKPGFVTRAVLAATLAGNYGIYSGYEFCEAEAIEGKEEYFNSEKYEYKVRDWNAPGNIKDLFAKLNAIRNENAALRKFKNLSFYHCDNDQVLFYGKASKTAKNAVFVVVNLDPHHAHDVHIDMPLDAFGIRHDAPYKLDDLMQGHSWQWQGSRQHLHLDPHKNPFAIFRLSQG